jgi:hypothetical protein
MNMRKFFLCVLVLVLLAAQMTFVRDRSGKATELILHQDGRDQRARRVE